MYNIVRPGVRRPLQAPHTFKMHIVRDRFVVAGISVIVSLLISLVQCVTCHLCGIGGVLDVIFAAAGTAWWVVVSRRGGGVQVCDKYVGRL